MDFSGNGTETGLRLRPVAQLRAIRAIDGLENRGTLAQSPSKSYGKYCLI